LTRDGSKFLPIKARQTRVAQLSAHEELTPSIKELTGS
jgi:hypothetical protein